MNRSLFLGSVVGFGLAAVVEYVLNWPSRRYLVDAEYLPIDVFQQKYPKKYWIGKIYRVFIAICTLVLLLVYFLVFLVFLLDSDALPFIFPITFFLFFVASDAISTGVFETITQVSRRKRKIHKVYKLPTKDWGPPIKYCYGKVARQAGKIRILLGIVVVFVDIAVIVAVANNINL